jgi:hypothetical protein
LPTSINAFSIPVLPKRLSPTGDLVQVHHVLAARAGMMFFPVQWDPRLGVRRETGVSGSQLGRQAPKLENTAAVTCPFSGDGGYPGEGKPPKPDFVYFPAGLCTRSGMMSFGRG